MFEWQVGNTTRFIKFEDITAIHDIDWGSYIVEIACGKTIQTMPANEYVRFCREYVEFISAQNSGNGEITNERL